MSTQYIISREEGHPTRFQKHDFEMKVAEIGPPSELIGSILRHYGSPIGSPVVATPIFWS